MNKVDKLAHTNEFFIKTKVLTFQDLVNYKIALIMFRASKGDLPPNIQKNFVLTKSSYSLRNLDNFQINYIRTTRKTQKNRNSLDIFKCRFKKLVFINYKDDDQG